MTHLPLRVKNGPPLSENDQTDSFWMGTLHKLQRRPQTQHEFLKTKTELPCGSWKREGERQINSHLGGGGRGQVKPVVVTLVEQRYAPQFCF